MNGVKYFIKNLNNTPLKNYTSVRNALFYAAKIFTIIIRVFFSKTCLVEKRKFFHVGQCLDEPPELVRNREQGIFTSGKQQVDDSICLDDFVLLQRQETVHYHLLNLREILARPAYGLDNRTSIIVTMLVGLFTNFILNHFV